MEELLVPTRSLASQLLVSTMPCRHQPAGHAGHARHAGQVARHLDVRVTVLLQEIFDHLRMAKVTGLRGSKLGLFGMIIWMLKIVQMFRDS